MCGPTCSTFARLSWPCADHVRTLRCLSVRPTDAGTKGPWAQSADQCSGPVCGPICRTIRGMHGTWDPRTPRDRGTTPWDPGDQGPRTSGLPSKIPSKILLKKQFFQHLFNHFFNRGKRKHILKFTRTHINRSFFGYSFGSPKSGAIWLDRRPFRAHVSSHEVYFEENH